MRTIKLAVLLVTLLLGACTSTTVTQQQAANPMERGAKWALLPIVNHTDVPQAGLRAETIADVLLRRRGIDNLRRYPPTLNPDSLFEPAERKQAEDALAWAHEQGMRYAVTGAVDEWHYRVGIDGEPAVGITLQIIDLKDNDRVVWSAAGAMSGTSRTALTAVAQRLMVALLDRAWLR